MQAVKRDQFGRKKKQRTAPFLRTAQVNDPDVQRVLNDGALAAPPGSPFDRAPAGFDPSYLSQPPAAPRLPTPNLAQFAPDTMQSLHTYPAPSLFPSGGQVEPQDLGEQELTDWPEPSMPEVSVESPRLNDFVPRPHGPPAEQASEGGGFMDRLGTAFQPGGSNSMALLAAGLGILANNYGHYGQAGPAIGKGGLIGVNMLNTLREQEQRNALRQQQMAGQEQQRALYRKQVEAQTASQERANSKDVALEAILREMEVTPPGPKRDQLKELYAWRTGQGAQFIKATTPGAGKIGKPFVMKMGTDAEGNAIEQTAVLMPDNTVRMEGEPTLKPKPAGMVSISMAGEKEFSKKYGGKQGDIATDIEGMADKAHGALQTTNAMIDYARRWKASGGQLGKLANAQIFASGLMQSLGMTPQSLGLPKDAGPGEALKAISNNLVLSKIGGEGGMPANNFSNADREFIEKTKPQVVDTPSGFVLKLMLERASANRAIARDEMLQDELDNFPGDRQQEAYQSFRRKWRAYVRSTPAFSAEERAEIEGLAKEFGGPAAPSGKLKPWQR
jgi:hypothetical protein